MKELSFKVAVGSPNVIASAICFHKPMFWLKLIADSVLCNVCNMKFHHLLLLAHIYTLNILLAWFQFIKDTTASWKGFEFQWG